MHSPEVDKYIAGCSEEHQQAITAIRALAHKVAPQVEESIQYKMPTFTVGDTSLCGISSRASYISLYCDPAVVKKNLAGLKGLDVGKSCIRFKKLQEIDLGTVQRIFAAILKGTKITE